MKLTFAGAAQTVTGSQTLLQHFGYSTLIDCGLYQGPKKLRELNWNKPEYFNKVQSIILTHAHVDHSGLLPRWASWGWKGPIFCTPATADLLQIMLMDAARLQEEDAKFANRTKHSFHDPALPLYTTEDAQKALRLLYVVPFNKVQKLTDQLSFKFFRAGHVLGSAFTQISYVENDQTKLITFSGDLGGGHSDLIRDADHPLETDDLVLESTYGDRKIPSIGREDRLAEIVNKVYSRQGTLVIPAFALGRAQDILYSLHRLAQKELIPEIPVYLDSPMANAVTKVYLKNLDELKREFTESSPQQALSPRQFKGVESADESMLLAVSDEPKIIISASGMLQGGRVLHHLKQKLPHSKNGVLFVGFQGQETKGRLLQNGILSIRLHHQEISVEAEIFTLEGYSAHGDADDLINWVKGFTKKPQRILLNHGEFEAQKVFAERIKTELKIETLIPSMGETIEL